MSITNARARIDIPGGVVAAITGHWKLLLAQGLVLEVLGLLAFTIAVRRPKPEAGKQRHIPAG